MSDPGQQDDVRGFREFEFDLPGALLEKLVQVLDGMEIAPLDVGVLASVPEAQGIYQLFLDGRLVYIGKTDAEAGLFRRLARHSRKTLHRHNLAPERVGFKAVRIFVFTAMDLETQLIRHYTAEAGTAWNGSGFGANDPGRKRDTSEPGRFDSEFPIDIDRSLGVDLSGTTTAAAVATQLKATLPYTLRFQSAGPRSRRPHPELESTSVTMTAASTSARTALEELTRQLPTGWQATALSALLILYKERVEDYPGATILARS
jgi:hypothetical protein